jgi:uncharacterized protein (DUF433 family)
MIRLRNRIVVDPEVHHGRPVIEGTRVPVEYDIAREDVLAALSYAAESVASEEFRAI